MQILNMKIGVVLDLRNTQIALTHTLFNSFLFLQQLRNYTDELMTATTTKFMRWSNNFATLTAIFAHLRTASRAKIVRGLKRNSTLTYQRRASMMGRTSHLQLLLLVKPKRGAEA
jgi:hypothetical protein